MVLSRSLLWAACAAVVVAGCGGSVSPVSSGGGDTGSAPDAVGTAQFRVDLGSGKVIVTPMVSDPEGRAIFTGSAVSVSSSDVLNDSGELTRRAIKVTLTNNTAEPIGADGTLRVVLDDFANWDGLWSDYSTVTTVSTPASVTRPYGVETDSPGDVYFSGKTTGQIYKMISGSAAVLASGFNGPTGLAVLPGTDLIAVAEGTGNVISLTSRTSGGRTVIAGTGAAGSGDGPGASATFSNPDGVTVDSLGNIYVSDAGTSRIRVISDPLGSPIVSTLVASGLTTIADIDAMQIKGSEYLIAATKHAVTGVSLPGGQVFTIAGTMGTSGNVNGIGDSARFKLVRGVDSVNGGIFVMDSQNYQVKQITLKPSGNPMNSADWHVALLAGDGTNAFADGPGYLAQFQYSQHLSASPSGRLYAASYSGDAIRQIVSQESYLPFLGSGGDFGTDMVKVSNASGHYSDGRVTKPYFDYHVAGGIAPGASFELTQWGFVIPENIAAFTFLMAVEASTELPAALDAVMTTAAPYAGSDSVFIRLIAGSAHETGYVDGTGPSSRFASPIGVDVADDGTLFVADWGSNMIRMMSPDGHVSTIAGHPSRYGDPTNTTGDLVYLRNPFGIAVNGAGTILYVTDYIANVVLRLSLISPGADRAEASNWDVRIIAGTGVGGHVNGPGDTAQFNAPAGIVIADDDRTLYLCDFNYNKIRVMTRSGSDPSLASDWHVDLLAGALGVSSTAGFVDGYITGARFDGPRDLAVGPDGTIYVTDANNSAIRAISPSGQVSTLAGDGVSGHVDAEFGGNARFEFPDGIDIDSSGFLYVTDFYGVAVRRVSTPFGGTRTVANGGSGPYWHSTGATFTCPGIYGLCVEPTGSVVVTTVGGLIRMSRIIDDAAR
jgi:sugar lactone lactonase YvrE